MFVLKDRILLPSGVSVIDDIRAAEIISYEGKLPPNFVVDGTETQTRPFERKYGLSISLTEENLTTPTPNVTHGDADLNFLYQLCVESERFDDELVNRLLEELDFFDRTNNIKFVLSLNDLVSSFKEDGVVWGVGRGSSIASYTLFLIEIHDINPCEYDIPFHEFSKER